MLPTPDTNRQSSRVPLPRISLLAHRLNTPHTLKIHTHTPHWERACSGSRKRPRNADGGAGPGSSNGIDSAVPEEEEGGNRRSSQRNLAARRRDIDEVHSDDGARTGSGGMEEVEVNAGILAPPPSKPGSRSNLLPRGESIPIPEQEKDPSEAERQLMPYPRRAVVLGDVPNEMDGSLPPSLKRKALPRASNLNSTLDSKSSHLALRCKASARQGETTYRSPEEGAGRGRDTAATDAEDRIAAWCSTRREEGETSSKIHERARSRFERRGGSAARDRKGRRVLGIQSCRWGSGIPPPPQAPKGEPSDAPMLSIESDSLMDHHLHPVNNGDFHDGYRMDIDGEEDYEDIDIDSDALDLAYPDENTPYPKIRPPPFFPSPPPLLSLTANRPAMARREELENGNREGKEDLLMDISHPDGGSPSPSAHTTNPVRYPHILSSSLPSPFVLSLRGFSFRALSLLTTTPSSSLAELPTEASSLPASASASPLKRKHKGNRWIKHKRCTGQRAQRLEHHWHQYQRRKI
ncbi:hypothetical protein BDN71DRAFT_1513401 [Pleurotus eryngii]|uniref:Uncharacterized protein n=1 Tax=Pleurotus eryngii TaxID=5323 RepID=A0A9P5ZGY4_PLEER|nr:hypothetical protein BDN71DRAFT_1513401 [Pleurotus eryngii]